MVKPLPDKSGIDKNSMSFLGHPHKVFSGLTRAYCLNSHVLLLNSHVLFFELTRASFFLKPTSFFSLLFFESIFFKKRGDAGRKKHV